MSQKVKTSYKIPHLRSLREQKLLTQEALATQSGVGRATIARIERGEGVNGITVVRLANALGVSRETLEEQGEAPTGYDSGRDADAGTSISTSAETA